MSHPSRTTTGKVLQRGIKQLRRVRQAGPGSPTLYFTLEGGSGYRSNVTFVDREHAPEFEGDRGWFEMEKLQAKPWSYWRAVKQVEEGAALAPPIPLWKTW